MVLIALRRYEQRQLLVQREGLAGAVKLVPDQAQSVAAGQWVLPLACHLGDSGCLGRLHLDVPVMADQERQILPMGKGRAFR